MKIDFYILNNYANYLDFSCRLIEKAFTTSNKITILANTKDTLQQLDRLLWNFKSESFIPHLPEDEITTQSKKVPVTLTCDNSFKANDGDILISLPACEHQNIDNFNRICIIVAPEQESLKHSRALYQKYKKQGHQILTHKI